MPGLFGVVSTSKHGDVLGPFRAVAAAMLRGGRVREETESGSSGAWGFGRLHLGVLQPQLQLDQRQTVQVLFHGDLDNIDELAASLAADGLPVAAEASAVVRELYRKHGRGAAKLLKGAFAAAVLDTASHELLLIADRLGSYPLYWFAIDDRIVFASELRAAVQAHPNPRLNPRAVADLLKFAFPMGNKTLAAGVDLVPQCATILCRPHEAPSIESYGTIGELFVGDATDRIQYTSSVVDAFSESMTRATRGAPRLGLSLSGGLDTRAILSALDRMGLVEGIRTFTLGGRGCADEVIAYQLARLARTNHRFVALDDHYLEDLLPTVSGMTALTDGMYVSHGFTEMLALSGFEDSDATVVLRGHAGELAKASTAWPFHTDARIGQMQSADEFVPYLLSRVGHVSRGEAAREVLSAEYADELDGAAERSLRETLDGVALKPLDFCSYIYLKEYHRRVTIASLEMFRTALEVRMPFADLDFLRAVLRGPSAWRDGVGLHQAIIRANGPAYLRVRNPNTGAPAGAGPVTEAVLDKVNTILRRLNVYGFRHYHAFDGWMRRSFLALVDKVLLDPETLEAGVFRESVIRARVDQARQGVADHDDLLQVLVNVELWRREALSREPIGRPAAAHGV